MFEEDGYALGEMDRRLGNVLRFGTVAAVDYAAALVRVDIGDLTTGWIPWLASRAGQDRVWNPPDEGEQVVVLSPGDPSQGIALPAAFQDAFPPNGNSAAMRRITFKDGTVLQLDRDGSLLSVTVPAAGSITLNVGGTTLLLQNGQATLTAAAITMNGPVTVNGNVAVNGSLSASAGGTFAGALTNNGVNVGSTHRHTEQGDGQEVSTPH